MNWLNEVTLSVFNDAWETFNNNFNTERVKFDEFYAQARNGEYIMMSVKRLTELSPENISLKRLNAKTPAEAYPPNDRPRGDADLKSVRYHMTHPVAPVVFIKIGKRMTLLDGMHRLVAASIIGAKIRLCVIKLNSL
jgi:hypothetical protein